MSAILFDLNGRNVSESAVPPSMTVLDYLREHRGLTGTKEGCAEGDCGACTIAIRKPGSERWEAVNSCIMLVPQLDECTVRTVEGVAGQALHPVQKFMAEGDGTQCGFCTPGFIMSLYAFHQNGEDPEPDNIHDALAGNLCRCTGYRPIIDACVAAAGRQMPEPNQAEPGRTGHKQAEYRQAGQIYIMPRTTADLGRALADNPDARIISGATDLGLLAGHDRQPLPALISTAHVAELREVRAEDDAVVIGAAASYSDALPMLDIYFASFADLVRRIGSRQIRALGTFGGNLGTASPVGDTLACLLALGAGVELGSSTGSRTMKVEDFILGYRKVALSPGEFIAAIRLPKLATGEDFVAYKISKRHDQDISIVLAAFRLRIEGGILAAFSAAYGGMAEKAKRAKALEAGLTGRAWVQGALGDVEALMAQDFTPLSDHRAGASYRLQAAANLVRRLQIETSGSTVPVRLEAL